MSEQRIWPGIVITLHPDTSSLPIPLAVAGAYNSSAEGGTVPLGPPLSRGDRLHSSTLRGILRVELDAGGAGTLSDAILHGFVDTAWDGILNNHAPVQRDGTAPSGFLWTGYDKILTPQGGTVLALPGSFLVKLDPRAVRYALSGTVSGNVNVYLEFLREER